jgi:hypothetical protein
VASRENAADVKIEELRVFLSKEKAKYVFSPKFIFLCGKGIDKKDHDYKVTNRGIIDRYIRNKASFAYIVLSEKIWEADYSKTIDLLTFEEFLAEISDCIIIFIESIGSSCELGAFTLQENQFQNKLILVLDQQYQNEESFINKGPVAKAISLKIPVIYADLGGPLLSSNSLIKEVDAALVRMQQKTPENLRSITPIEKNGISLRTFIIEIIELIQLLQPVTSEELISVYKRLKNLVSFSLVKQDGTKFTRKIEIRYLLQLLVVVGIVKSDGSFFSSNELLDSTNILFNFSFESRSRNRARSRILARRFHYKMR